MPSSYIEQYKSYQLATLAILIIKRSQHYEYVFKYIKDNINQFKARSGSFFPNILHIDKEIATIKTCKKIFPQTKIILCFFHFIYNIKNRINNLVFKDLFNSNNIALQWVFGCKAISFIPYIYIKPIFEYLLEKAHNINDPNLNKFMTYFANEWIYGTEYSYYNYYKEFEIKANNPSEGFNYKLNNIFKNKRPFLYHALYEDRILIKG